MKTFFTLLFFSAFLIPAAKAGTFGMGDYVWKDDATQNILKTDSSYVKNDRKPVDLEISLGMWTFFKTQGNGTIVLQYARGNANKLPYITGSDGTTQAQSPNYQMSWQTINTDSLGKDWVLARNFSSLTEGSYTPSGLTDYSGLGAYVVSPNETPNIIDFGGKIITSNGNGITLDGTTVPGFISGAYNYMKGALKFAIMPGSTVLPDSVYSFRLYCTSANWDGSAAGQIGELTINFNTFEGTQNRISSHSSEGTPDPNAVNGGNHFDHGMPIIATGPNILINNSLPITWSTPGLQGTVAKNSVILTWGTQTEINSNQFIVQRSADAGKTYSNLGIVTTKAENGNSNSALSYSFTDASPIANAIYRIEEIDHDGKSGYSNTISISFNKTAAKLTVYPNPVTSGTSLNVKGAPSGSTYRIIGISGAGITNGVLSSSNQVNVDMLVPGVYILQVGSNGSFAPVKFIKK